MCPVDYSPAQYFRSVLYIHLEICKTNSCDFIKRVGQMADTNVVRNRMSEGKMPWDLGVGRRLILL